MPPPSLARVPIHGTRVSRAYEPDDPDFKKKKVKPLKLSDMARDHIPRDHARLHQILLRTMPEAMFEPGIYRKITDLLQRYCTMDVHMWLHGVRIHDTNKLRSLIPGVSCLVVMGLPPRSEKIIVEVELQFVYKIVGELLGGKAAPVDIHRPLTEIEQGVFLFIALKVVAMLQEGWANTEQVALRIEDVRGDIKSAADLLRAERRWMCSTWKLTYGTDTGVIRALIPESLARTVVMERPPAGSPLAERVRAKVRQRLHLIADTPVEGWIEVGHIQELGRADLAGLDPGDIVLLDACKVEVVDGVVSGPAELRIGLGRHGFLRGQIMVQEGRQVFEVQEIVIEEVPAAHDPVEGHGEHDNPENVVASYEDAPDENDGDEHDPRAVIDDALEEDWGIGDEDDGDDEEYAEGGEEPYEEGQGGAEGEGEPAPVEDNLEQVEPLLGDIPMVLVVELGRVQLTADEVVRLRPGQIIELGRSPVDPVDLVVNGKLVAKGELVEIDGALGVKLLNLVKGGE